MIRYIKNIGADKLFAWFISFCAVSLTFCPYVGMIISIPVIGYVLYKYKSRITFGSKWVVIPLLIILVSIIASHNWIAIFIAFYYFGIYLVARIFGKDMFTPFLWGIGIYAVYLIVCTILFYGVLNPSIVNYHLGGELLVFGAIVCRVKKQWLLLTVVGIGLFFDASEIAWFAMILVLIVMIVRKDFDKKMFIPIGVTIFVAVIGIFPFNYTKLYYGRALNSVSVAITNTEVVSNIDLPPIRGSGFLNIITDDRYYIMQEQIPKFSILGTGYQMYPQNYTLNEPIHLVPLIIVQQVGYAAAIAWLIVTIVVFRKTKYKYAFVAIFGICLFDHSIWTELACWWFMLLGIATLPNQTNDYFNKKLKNEETVV
jgi:hypothetical protein